MIKNTSFLRNDFIAHRGIYDNIKVPENSIVSFKEAIKNEYPIELDVRLTKDNKVVVFHDKNLLRLCNINKLVKDTNYSELKDYKLLNTNNYIPLLEEVLKIVNGKIPIIIELKIDRKNFTLEREVIKFLNNYHGLYAIQSFSPLSIIYFKMKYPHIIRGLLIKNNKYLGLYSLITKPNFISYNIKRVSKNKILKYKNKYLLLGWTVKNKEEYLRNKDICDNLICENIKNIKE